MQLALQILSVNQYFKAIHGMLGRRTVTESHLPPEKSRFSFNFGKNSSAEKFRLPNPSTTVNYIVAKAGKEKADGSSQYFYWKNFKSWDTQWAVVNVKRLSKEFKVLKFFGQKLAEKLFWQTLSQRAAQLNNLPSISTKTTPLQSWQ